MPAENNVSTAVETKTDANGKKIPTETKEDLGMYSNGCIEQKQSYMYPKVHRKERTNMKYQHCQASQRKKEQQANNHQQRCRKGKSKSVERIANIQPQA